GRAFAFLRGRPPGSYGPASSRRHQCRGNGPTRTAGAAGVSDDRPPGPATGPANAADSPPASRSTRAQARAGTLQSAIRLGPASSFGAIGSPPTEGLSSFGAIGSVSAAGSSSFRGASSP